MGRPCCHLPRITRILITRMHAWPLQVVDVKVVLTRQARPNTQPARIAECLVGDQTGCIIFTARNEQGAWALAGDWLTA